MSEHHLVVIKDDQVIAILKKNGYICEWSHGSWYTTNFEIDHRQALRLVSGDIIQSAGTGIILLTRKHRTDIPIAVETFEEIQSVRFTCIECASLILTTQSYSGCNTTRDYCKVCRSKYEVCWRPGGGPKVYIHKLPDTIDTIDTIQEQGGNR